MNNHFQNLKKNKELFFMVMKYYANDESMASYMKHEHLKKKFINEAKKSFGTANVNEVFYNGETDSYEINPNCIAPVTNPNTKK